MSTVQFRSKVKFTDLLKGLEQLSPKELDKLIKTARLLQTQYANLDSNKLEELMEIARMTLPPKIESRYQVLLGKKRDGSITDNDQTELEKMVDLMEEMDLKKAEAIYTISKYKGISGKKLLKQLKK